MQKAEDEGGVLLEEEEEDMYNHARPGDQYMIESQCDLCHFRNVNRRNPAMKSWTDVTLLRYICMAPYLRACTRHSIHGVPGYVMMV